MTYVKIMQGGTVVSVGTAFVYWQKRNNLLLLCQQNQAELICSYDEQAYYHLPWLNPVSPDMELSYEEADGQIISQDEYEILYESLAAGQEVLEDEIVIPSIEEEPVLPDAALEELKERKIQSLSDACRKKIVCGFSLALSDGIEHNFTLQIVDQLNLNALLRDAERGVSPLLYSESGIGFYEMTVADAQAVVKAMDEFVLQQREIYADLRSEALEAQSIEALNAISFP